MQELYDYTDFSWARHARVMEGLGDEEFTAPVPNSGWPSFQRAFLHVVGAYDGWINDDWGLGQGGSIFAAVESWDELYALVPWAKLQEYRVATREAFRKALAVSDDELFTKRGWNLMKEPEQLSRADILTNLLLHERGHHGDISTLFYQAGLTGVTVDYRFFKSRPNEFDFDTEDGDEAE